MEKSCPQHPEQDTMVPCLGCGKYFCRVCHTPRGAGQFCPHCFEKEVTEIGRRGRRPAPAEAGSRPSGGTLKRLLSRAGAGGKQVIPGSAYGYAAPRRGSPAGATAAGPSAFGRFGKAFARKLRSAADRAAELPGRAASLVSRTARERFPFTLVEKEAAGGMPPLAEAWLKLLIFVLGGTLLWTALVSAGHHRRPMFSVLVALLVSAGVAWSLGPRFDPLVGLLAMSFSLLSLALGEIAVQALFRAGVLRTLDISVENVESEAVFYRDFFFRLLVVRMLPSAAVAFLVGWWPLPRRVSWKGFGRKER